jgi:hypothetical protein
MVNRRVAGAAGALIIAAGGSGLLGARLGDAGGAYAMR